MPNDYLRYSPIHPPIVIEKSHLTEIQEMQDSAKPVTDACRKADEAWQSVLWGFVGFMINRTIGCLPLLQRVFIHPSHIEQYEERAIALGLGGAGLMVLYAIGGILGLHDWSLGVVSWLGIGLLAVAAVAFALCLAHLAIAARHPEKSTGAGFGLLNIHCLLTGRQPSRSWTLLQDGTLVAVALWKILSYPADERLIPGMIILAALGAILGPCWWAHLQTSKESA